MSEFPCAVPPHSVHVVELVLISCQRGQGAALRNVTQVWTKDGDLVAEHDHIHDDPVYASHFLREALANTAKTATENVAIGV